jgi:flagellar protein FliJ
VTSLLRSCGLPQFNVWRASYVWANARCLWVYGDIAIREELLAAALARCERVRAMKSNDTLLKLRRFEVNEKRQKVTEIDVMIGDFKRMADDLSHQIKVEEETCGVRDINHFSYPTYAKAARQRRDNLLASIQALETKQEEARAQLVEAQEELKKSELVEERSIIDHDRPHPGQHGLNAAPAGHFHSFSTRP